MNITDHLQLNSATPMVPGGSGSVDKPLDAQKEKFARDFESVFIEKLLDEMKNTIGDWGYEQDAASRQIQGLFWLHLGRDVSQKGGFGLWKDIYRSLDNLDNSTTQNPTIENKA